VEELALQSMIRSREEDVAAAPGAEDPQQVRRRAAWERERPFASPIPAVLPPGWEWLPCVGTASVCGVWVS